MRTLFHSPHEHWYIRGTTFARRICIIAHTLAVTIAHSRRDNYISYSHTALVAQFRDIVVAIAAIFFPEYQPRILSNRETRRSFLSFSFRQTSIIAAFIGLDLLCFVSFRKLCTNNAKNEVDYRRDVLTTFYSVCLIAWISFNKRIVNMSLNKFFKYLISILIYTFLVLFIKFYCYFFLYLYILFLVISVI